MQLIYIQDFIVLFLFNIHITNNLWLSAIFALFLYLGIFALKAYDTEILSSINESIIRITVGTIIGIICILLLYPFLTKYIQRHILLYDFVFTIIIIPILHKADYYFYKSRIKVLNCLVIGRKKEIGHILQDVERNSLEKLKFVEYINPTPTELQNEAKKYDAILIADPNLKETIKTPIDYFIKRSMRIEYLPNLVEKYLKRIPEEVLKKFRNYYEIAFSVPKHSRLIRVFDLGFASIFLILFSPILLIVMLAIKLEDGSEIFFKQIRVGYMGNQFTIYKLRTMNRVINNEGDYEDVPIKIGKYIRKFRINEIPQLINVLKGQMSLVGPRPDIIDTYEFCSKNIHSYNYRLKVLPGITGSAQIWYKYVDKLDADIFSKRLSYDLYYINNYNIFNYFGILLRTVETIIMGSGH